MLRPLKIGLQASAKVFFRVLPSFSFRGYLASLFWDNRSLVALTKPTGPRWAQKPAWGLLNPHLPPKGALLQGFRLLRYGWLALRWHSLILPPLINFL